MTQQPFSTPPPDFGPSAAAPGRYASSYSAPYPPYGGAPMGGPPPSNAGWAVATVLFFWPLAFAAFNRLHSIVPLWLRGDHQGALEASEKVKKLGKIALTVFVAIFVGFFLMYGILIASLIAAANSSGIN